MLKHLKKTKRNCKSMTLELSSENHFENKLWLLISISCPYEYLVKQTKNNTMVKKENIQRIKLNTVINISKNDTYFLFKD